MIPPFLAAKGLLGLKNIWWLAIAAGLALAAFITIRVIDNAVEDVIDTAKDAGATEQREGDLRETLERTETGNAAREDIRSSDSARYDECLRTARTPENCQRFLPE